LSRIVYTKLIENVSIYTTRTQFLQLKLNYSILLVCFIQQQQQQQQQQQKTVQNPS